MKAFNFSHWNMSEAHRGLLFFAQSLEEMLFHYGHDSLKVPALNFHSLCIEIHNTIKKIEAEIIDKGNMRPLFEELRASYENDPIAKGLFGDDFSSLFFIKNALGEIERKYSDIIQDPSTETSIKRIKRVVKYLLNDMSLNDRYFEELKKRITEIIKGQQFTVNEQANLYHLSRILLTELINGAYSQEFIYWIVNDTFYNYQKPINSIDDALSLFWSYFDFQEKEYTVILPLRVAAFQKHLIYFNNVSVQRNDKGLFGGSCKWIIELNINAMDQYNAQTNAIELVSFFTSLLLYNNHRSKSYSVNSAIVKLNNTDQVYHLQTPLIPVRRGNVLSDEKNNEKIASMVNNFAFSPRKLVSVIGLHSSAINSNDITNQLLADLRNCIPDVIESKLADICEGNSDLEKIVAILVLPKYHTDYSYIFTQLVSFPLLQYRIQQYSTLFSHRKQLKDFLTAHRKRISWHLMRIYRNRNMIVHDGSYFPYIDIIVQNLHYYVDSLIDVINLYAGRGYSSIETIYTVLQQREYQHQLALEEKENDGSPKKVLDDFPSVVLGYLH